MSACESIRAELKAYLDRELSPLAHSRVRRHLETCANCRAESETLAHLSAQLRTLDNATPRPELRARILAQLPEDPKSSPVKQGRNMGWRRLPALALAAGSIAGLILLVEAIHHGPPMVPLSPNSTPLHPDIRIALETHAPMPAQLPNSAQNKPNGDTVAKTPSRNTNSLKTSLPDHKKTAVPIAPNNPSLEHTRIAASDNGQRKMGHSLSPKPRPQMVAGKPSNALDSPILYSAKTSDGTRVTDAKQLDTPLAASNSPLPANSQVMRKELSSSVNHEEALALSVDSLDTKTAQIESAAKSAGASVKRGRIDVDKDGARSTSITILVDSSRAESLKSQVKRLDVSGSGGELDTGGLPASPLASRKAVIDSAEKKSENESTSNAHSDKTASEIGKSTVSTREAPETVTKNAVGGLQIVKPKVAKRDRRSKPRIDKSVSTGSNDGVFEAAPSVAGTPGASAAATRAITRAASPGIGGKTTPKSVAQKSLQDVHVDTISNRNSPGKSIENRQPGEITKITIRLREAVPKK